MSDQSQVISTTESVCPECLSRIPAEHILRGGDVFMRKTCPDHGDFETVVWRGDPSFDSWTQPGTVVHSSNPLTAVDQGCPFDCGLCPDHRGQTGTAVLEVTRMCDLRCPYCYASAGSRRINDPTLKVIEGWYQALLGSGGSVTVQLSGGEPTLRTDLPDVVALGRSLGFSSILVSTNGLRLARDADYVRRLKEAGLSSVLLQFDTTNDDVMKKMRGVRRLDRKRIAIENCAACDLDVVLVALLVPGVNTGDIGAVVDFALGYFPAVRGVHFQPLAYVGRYPGRPSDPGRFTIPDVLRALEAQTGGRVRAGDFTTTGCENALCSLHGDFVVMPDGTLHPANQLAGASSTGARTFRITGMAYQDAWTLDLERLKDCCVHTVSPDGRLVPFCAYNLTSRAGKTLYRGHKPAPAARP